MHNTTYRRCTILQFCKIHSKGTMKNVFGMPVSYLPWQERQRREFYTVTALVEFFDWSVVILQKVKRQEKHSLEFIERGKEYLLDWVWYSACCKITWSWVLTHIHLNENSTRTQCELDLNSTWTQYELNLNSMRTPHKFNENSIEFQIPSKVYNTSRYTNT